MSGEHRERGVVPCGRPRLLVAFDSDSRATAYCAAQLEPDGAAYRIIKVDGGGRPLTAVPWTSVAGCEALLRELLGDHDPADVLIAVEAQVLKSQWIHDCADLIAWRWRCDTIAQQLGIRVLHVQPSTWQRRVAPEGFKRGGAGKAKALYQARAKELAGPKLAKNEDRCAAIGIAWWLASDLGCELRGPA